MSPLSFDPRNEGYWGDTTSTLDWCEDNYEVPTSPRPPHPYSPLPTPLIFTSPHSPLNSSPSSSPQLLTS